VPTNTFGEAMGAS